MNTDILSPDDTINQMIELRLQLAKLERQIETLKPAFFDACAAQEAAQFRHEHAIISRRLTRGTWDYPTHILEQEEHLKQLRLQFQQTNEPTAGREITWSIKLTTQI